MLLGVININRRFRGPPSSANGGYCCGRLAAFIEGAAEVTLRRPPPLEKDLSVRSTSDGSVALYDGEELIATACRADVAVEATAPPTFEDAVAASRRTFDPAVHKLPMCFVCGPDRDPGDGLRIFCGPLAAEDYDWSGPVAAPWVPEPYTADASGDVAPEFVWAALDCPTAYAAGSPQGFPTILLGRQAVAIERPPKVGEHCVVTAWLVRREGRKYYAEAALFGEGGALLARCRATWIEVDRDVQLGVKM
jgi:hypothetical protein